MTRIDIALALLKKTQFKVNPRLHLEGDESKASLLRQLEHSRGKSTSDSETSVPCYRGVGWTACNAEDTCKGEYAISRQLQYWG